MEAAHEWFTAIREIAGDKCVLDEIERYLSTDELKKLCDTLDSVFDIDYWNVEDEEDE